MDNVIFITSFLKKERIFEFAYRGFVIIELHATLNGLIRRKRKRDTPGDRFIDQFRENFKYYFQVVDDLALNALFSLRLDMTHLSTNEALKRIIDTISYQDAKSHLTEDGKLYVVTVSRLREFIKRHFQGIFGNYTKLVQGKTHTVALAQH